MQLYQRSFTHIKDLHLADVHKLDFASMYPNIIRTRNVSPETVRCGCCGEDDARDIVLELGYTICQEEGYHGDILGPLIDDRDAMKATMQRTDDPAERARLEVRSSAIKWILVSCFGYQGHANAKFGRIECHETINAYARQILLDAKAALEEGGWRVLHGIVDSIWVTPAADVADRDRRTLVEIAAEVQQRVSKHVEEYRQETLTVCALRRMKRQGAPLALGQTIEYTVVDVDAHGTGRVRLSHEHADEYDVDWYRDQCIRAAVGVLSPVGYYEPEIEDSLADGSMPSIQSYE